MALTPGTKIGSYEITAQIGVGGMGEVYRATDTNLGRAVAIKVLPDAVAQDAERLARFDREARTLAALNHRNIATIHGLERSGGTTALVMELVEGPTLADRIAHGALPVAEALPIAKQIAEAIEAAHEQGIVHRDLKPANVKVKADGTVKVLDFGLAKAMEPTGAMSPGLSQSPTITTPAMTQAGLILGTAAYMSPEQARGKPVDRRADIWAFGCVLYEMLTGRQAFAGEDVTETLAAVVKTEPDRSRVPKLDPLLDVFLWQCLRKDPRERLGDIREMRLALAGAFETPPLAVSEGAGVRPRARAVVAGLILVSLAVGGLAGWLLARPGLPGVGRFSIPLAGGASLDGFLDGRAVAVSPDGQDIVFQLSDGLWKRPIGRLESTRIPGAEGGASPFFSPDGRTLGFRGVDLTDLMVVPADGDGPPVRLAVLNGGWAGASFTDDGRILYAQRDGIWSVPVTAGSPDLLFASAPGELYYGPQMLPGGEWVLLTVRSQEHRSWDEADIVAQSVETGERVEIMSGGSDGRYLPSGHLIWAVGNELYVAAFDEGMHSLTGPPVRVVQGVRRGSGGQATGTAPAAFDVSASGSLVYYTGTSAAAGTRVSNLAWVTREGVEEVIPAPPQIYQYPRVSPDGTRIAVAVVANDNVDIRIWDGSTLTPITFDAAVDTLPLWLDADRVMFSSSRDGGGLYWKRADGSGQVQRVVEGPARPFAVTPDGHLVFEQGGEVRRMALDDGSSDDVLFPVQAEPGLPAVVSPDGRWVAAATLQLGFPTINVRPFPDVEAGGPWRMSETFARDPVWSPDGRELYFRNSGGAELMAVRVETGEQFRLIDAPRRLFDLSAYDTVGEGRFYDIAPDGDRFVVLKPVPEEQAGEGEPVDGLFIVTNWFAELTRLAPAR